MAKNVYAIVNEKVLKALEAGTNPWVKPWIGKEAPFNITTGKTYSLLNQICLSKVGPYATLKQWNGLGGRIKKGSKAETVCFWSIFSKKVTKDGEEKEEKIPLLKHYNVFNIEDVVFPEGKTPKKVEEYLASLEERKGGFEHERHEKAEEVLMAYVTREGILFEEKESNRAFYSPSDDYVQVPELSQFPDLSQYYSTKAHELVHSTGHSKRLDRDLKNGYGSEKYSREELIAEMGAAYFMALLGLETPESFNNSAAYIEGWKSYIKQDERAVVVAAGKAQKAIEFILGKSVDEFEGA